MLNENKLKCECGGKVKWVPINKEFNKKDSQEKRMHDTKPSERLLTCQECAMSYRYELLNNNYELIEKLTRGKK